MVSCMCITLIGSITEWNSLLLKKKKHFGKCLSEVLLAKNGHGDALSAAFCVAWIQPS